MKRKHGEMMLFCKVSYCTYLSVTDVCFQCFVAPSHKLLAVI